MSVVSSEVIPLLSSQRGLWAGQKIDPSVSMTLAELIELRGKIDVSILLRASKQVAQDFETLRSRIIEEQGIPKIHIDPDYNHPIPFIDATKKKEKNNFIDRLIQAEIERKIDISKGPNWRCILIKKEEKNFIWVNFGHHVLIDGYSGSMVVQRLSIIYNAYLAGHDVPPPDVEGVASLYELEQNYQKSKRFSRDQSFWKNQLADAPVAPTLSNKSKMNKESGLLRASGSFTPKKVQQLRELGRHFETSLPQVLIALVATYYYRLTRAEDLIFGMPVTGRVNHRYRKIPGLVANAVLIRLKMNPDSLFCDLFKQVTSVVTKALRHQQYRYEDIRRDFGLIGKDQQFSTLAVNIEVFNYKLNFGGCTAVPCNISNGSGEDLTIFFYERSNGDELRFDIDCNPSLYTQEEVISHCRRIEELANKMIDDPFQSIGYVELIDEVEKNILLKKWNDTDFFLPEPATIIDYFLRQADLTPNHVAVECSHHSLTYNQLKNYVLTLAYQWRKNGICQGDIVAIALPRYSELLVAILAVMQTGAAYLPIDPDGPKRRTQSVLAAANVKAVACHEEWREKYLSEKYNWLKSNFLFFKPDQIINSFDVKASPDQIAYILYTSGSTGEPKGVVIRHRSLANFAWAMRQDIDLGKQKRCLALTTIIFDISGLEFFLPLITGGTVVLAENVLLRDPLALARFIKEKNISVMQATPSVWRTLLGHSETDLTTIHALVGGEPLTSQLAAQLIQRSGRVTHLYGPTETTIWSTIMSLEQKDVQTTPIGRPISNTRVYVLDNQRQILPIGTVGELYIAGMGVAAEYWQRPDLTKQSFYECPFYPGYSMYRTGDLVRWNADGYLEFIGRIDGQLKIRGHRVEPGEIENVLMSLPEVREAVVNGHESLTGNTIQLVAYLTLHQGVELNVEMLRQNIRGILPKYMIPNQFIQLDKFPLLSNGKINRKKLPVPIIKPVHQYVAPRTAIEQQLVNAWQSLLGIERIGIHDNFFELGGDSLTAAEFLSNFSNLFGVELPFGSLFSNATIAELAAQVNHPAVNSSFNDPLGMVLKLRNGIPQKQSPLFCIHPVLGLGWSYSTLLPLLDPSIPVYVLQSPSIKPGSVFAKSIEELAHTYLKEIRRIQSRGPYRLVGWSLGGFISHAIAAILTNEGEKIDLLAILDAYPYKNLSASIDSSMEAATAMRYLGIPLEAGSPLPQGREELAAILCKHYRIDQIPLVKHLLDRDQKLLVNIGLLTQHHLHLAQKYRPSLIDVDMIFFSAQKRHYSRVSDFIEDQPEAWKKYARLNKIYYLECDHQSMFDHRYASDIAVAINHQLALLDTSNKENSAKRLNVSSTIMEQIENV